MTPTGPDRLWDERHQQNLARFSRLETDLSKNTEQTGQALREVSAVRHDLRGFKDTVQNFIDTCRDEKKERREEMKEQAEQIRKLSNRFIWATGLIAGLSFAGQLFLAYLHHH